MAAARALGSGQVSICLSKRHVDVVEALVQPEGLEHLPPVFGVALVEAGDPFLQRRQDFLLGPLAELAAGAIAGPVLVDLSRSSSSGTDGAGDLGLLDQRALG